MSIRSTFSSGLKLILLLACSLCSSPVGAEEGDRGDALIEAVRKGDGTAASALLGEGADANARDRSGTTALMRAALDASPALMTALLEKGADVNARNEADATALLYAVSSLEKVRLLLDRGAEVDARDENGCTALILAAGYDGPVEIVKALLDRGADVNARAADDIGSAGVTPLMRAARSGDRDKVALLLGRGADVNVRNKKNGSTALWLAAARRDIPTVGLLLDRGADIDVRTLWDSGGTLLMEAAYNGSVDLMGVLLDRGMDLDARDNLGMTALMWAASNDDGDVEALKLLLARGADRDAKDKGGRTALMLAKDALPTPAMSLLASPVPAGRRGLPPDRAAAAGRAVERSIPLLERSGPGFFEGAAGLCVSCHHQSLPALALAAARERGFRVDEAMTRRWVEQTRASMPRRANLLDGVGTTFINPSVAASYLLVGLAVDGQPPSGTTETLVHQLAGWQARDGRWTSLGRRAPLEQSDVTATALAMRALKAYAPPGRAGEMADRIRRASAWLAAVAPRTTEEWSFQMLGLAWAEGDPAAIRRGAAALLAEQRPDGGWAQVPARASDAYATGQALVALHRAGGLPIDDPAYRRGVDFLLGSQYEDGSWLVETRSHPHRRLPYFETGFPHEDSQFISCAGTAWATWALALAAPRRGGRAQQSEVERSPTIPKVWVDKELASLQVPLATPEASPVLVKAEFYVRIPVRTIFKSYPIYAPDREPPGYLDWLNRQEPVDAWAAARRDTEEDRVKAGELVFDAPIQLGDADTPSFKLLRDAAWLKRVGMPIARDGVIPFRRYVIREKGKVEVGNFSCANCHTRVMPDGSVIKGAQGNFPNAALGFGDEIGLARRLTRLLFDAPWIRPDPLAPIDRMSAADIGDLAAAEPLGVMARHGTSFFSPVQVPDLIGIEGRRYLDHTGLVVHRVPADLMRYAALNQDTDLLSRYGDFVPLGAFLGRPPEPTDRGIGTGRYSDEQLHALAIYLYALKPPPNPNASDSRASRGEAVFRREECGRCHTPPLFTNNRLMPVVGFRVPEGHRDKHLIASGPIDTDPDLTLRTRRGTGYYKVPSLRGVWYRSMFGHGGWCATLEDWFDPRRLEDDYRPTGFIGHEVTRRAVPGHEYGLDLNEEEKKSLIAYLKTL